VTLKEGDAN